MKRNRDQPKGRRCGVLACLGILALGGQSDPGLLAADGAETEPANPATTNPAFLTVSPAQRAPWQQKLTLGAGDILSFSLYGEEKDMTRKDVPIGPDGRVSYLEAQNIIAAGLTVDEFRDRLNEELGKHRRAAQAFVVPVAYRSKKYFIVGSVTQRGVFSLDRPVTLIEAVARARGTETGPAADRRLGDLADLSRSFVLRGGRKLPVNFEKLFLHGDLAQNVAIEPDDYIHFATARNEVLVLGAVQNPGMAEFTAATGALAAVGSRGGFTARAWKQKLLVIRGSFAQPELFTVNAQLPDVTLRPKDIVYVSDRAWNRPEELLDAAAAAFATSAIARRTELPAAPADDAPIAR